MAWFAQAGMATRANNPILANTPSAAWALGCFLQRLKQGFFFQGALVFFFQSLAGAKDQVYQHAG